MAFLFVGFVSSWFSGSFSLEGCQLSVPGHPWGRLMSSCLPDHYTTCSPLQCCPLAALPLEMLGWPLLWNHHEIVCKNAPHFSPSSLPPAVFEGAKKKFPQSGGSLQIKGKKKKKKKNPQNSLQPSAGAQLWQLLFDLLMFAACDKLYITAISTSI